MSKRLCACGHFATEHGLQVPTTNDIRAPRSRYVGPGRGWCKYSGNCDCREFRPAAAPVSSKPKREKPVFVDPLLQDVYEDLIDKAVDIVERACDVVRDA